MTQLNLVDSFKEFKEFKNIDHEVMMGILEDVFRAMILKKYGDDSNFDIIINPDKGDLEIWRNRDIVADDVVEDENQQVSISEALRIEDDFEVGEELSEEIKLESFGRRNVLSLRQIWPVVLWNWRRTPSIRSTRSGWERLSLQRFIKSGSEKFFLWMMMIFLFLFLFLVHKRRH